MGFEICGILVLWEKGGEEGRNRERKVGQEPWSIKGQLDETWEGPSRLWKLMRRWGVIS